jgi:hypothetical protein
MKKLLFLVLLSFTLSARNITPTDVYSQVMKINSEMVSLLHYYSINYNEKKIREATRINTPLKPRNVWQLTYEIAIKINMLRIAHKLPTIEPINMEPVLNLNPDLVYEQTQRILTEIKIYKFRLDIKTTPYKVRKYKNKTPLDVFNALSTISGMFDKLNQAGFTPSYVFGESMRVYDDLTTILNHLGIEDNTVPTARNDKATPIDTFEVAMKILEKIKQIQFSVGIATVNFSAFRYSKITPSTVFTMNQMILAELQTIKAYVGLKHYITPAATTYVNKTPADVDQLMNWNLRKVTLLNMGIRKSI